jgi:hypothetical protein
VGHEHHARQRARHRLAGSRAPVGAGWLVDDRLRRRPVLRLDARGHGDAGTPRRGGGRHDGGVRGRARCRCGIRGHRLRLRRHGVQPRRDPRLGLDVRLRGHDPHHLRDGRPAGGRRRTARHRHRTGHRPQRPGDRRPAGPRVARSRRGVDRDRRHGPGRRGRRGAQRRTRHRDHRVPLAPAREPVRRRGLVRPRHRHGPARACGDPRGHVEEVSAPTRVWLCPHRSPRSRSTTASSR